MSNASLLKRYKLPERLRKKTKGRIDYANKEKNRHKHRSEIRKAAEKHGVPVSLFEALVETESAFDENALSQAGALGLTQLMPATAKRFGVTDRTNPVQSLNAGARYLRQLLNLFKHNAYLALAGYNAGENAVIRFKYQIPPYKETQQYIKKVMALYRQKKVQLQPLISVYSLSYFKP
jgi:soluble lytic murein transglycosylase-like protein